MTIYIVSSRYIAQALLALYIIGYLIGVEYGSLILGTVGIILLTIGLDLLYKKVRARMRRNFQIDQLNNPKFVLLEKINLYSKVYCIAVIIGLPLSLVFESDFQGAFLIFSFIGLLIFSRRGLSDYINKRLDIWKDNKAGSNNKIFDAN